MKAGRELDALVAERVMGETVAWGKTWTWMDWNTSDHPTETHGPGIPREKKPPYMMSPPLEAVPAYSTDIAAAWEVVEKMQQEYDITVGYEGDVWKVDLVEIESGLTGVGDAEAAPLAICLAAMRALSVADNCDGGSDESLSSAKGGVTKP